MIYAAINSTIVQAMIESDYLPVDAEFEIVALPNCTGWPPKPHPAAILHYIDGALVYLDPRSLDQVKADKWTEIKNARAAAIDAPLVLALGTFDADETARRNIADLILLCNNYPSAPDIDYTLADNSVATLTPAQIIAVGLALGARTQTIYATARTLRESIESAVTAAELAAVVWP
jgi:hypothetical protein